MSTIWGAAIVAFAGLLTGGGGFPIKFMRKYKFEHFWFVSFVFVLIVLPWVVTLGFCPHPFEAYRSVDPKLILRANLFSFAWGIANVLNGLCLLRIGFALSGGIILGTGVSLGTIIPLMVKGSGLFSSAPDLASAAGHAVLVGVAIMLTGVVFITLAGFGRERQLQQAAQPTTGSYLGGLIMALTAGVLSVGQSFSFVYTQGPIIDAMRARGASVTGATFAVWAVGLMGGALVNVLYPAYLMTKNKSWHVLAESRRELAWCLFMSTAGFFGISLMGKGMLVLGALGASVGFGIQQSSVLLSLMGVGFVFGEWRGIRGVPRKQIYFAIALLTIGATILAYGNSLVRH